LPDDFVSSQKFDVDGDGKDELIFSVCTDGGIGRPYTIHIIRDNKIIFSLISLNGKNIIPTKNKNGFYAIWIDEKTDYFDKNGWRGYCCALGHKKTRFVYEKGKFVPVYEQDVVYLDVNTDKK